MQVNERGFLTMLSSGAILPAAELMAKAGHKIDWSDFIAPVATYFTKDGMMMAMPFNSSTPILFYNTDHFKAAGFDKPASTWPELEAQLYAISKKGVSKCAMVFPADWEWSFLENYSAIEDIPYATKRNGFDGLDAEYVFNKGPGLSATWSGSSGSSTTASSSLPARASIPVSSSSPDSARR